MSGRARVDNQGVNSQEAQWTQSTIKLLNTFQFCTLNAVINSFDFILKVNMTSFENEGVFADIKRQTDRTKRAGQNFISEAQRIFNPSHLTDKSFHLAKRYLAKMQKIFNHLRKDIYSFLSKFGYKFQIDFDFLFHLTFGVYRLVCYDNKYDLMMTLIYVVKTFLGNKVGQFMDIVCIWCSNFIDQLKSMGKCSSEAMPEFVPEFSFTKWFDLVVDSKIAQALRQLILNLVGLKFFSKETSERFFKTLGPPRPVCLMDMCRNVLQTVEEFLMFGVNYTRTGSFIEALAARDPTVAFLEKTYVLTLQAKYVYIGDDANFQKLSEMRGDDEATEQANSSSIAAKDFIMKLRSAVIEGNTISASRKVPPAFKARMYALTELLQELMQKMRSKNRRAPFGLILHGDPSIGKSSILVHIYKTWAKYKNLDYSRDLVYDRNPKSKYWTNHDPISQPIIHYPELGSVAFSIVKNKGDDTVDEMLMVADTQPFSAEMAVAEDKGKCMVMPELLVIDCNDPRMNLEFTNNNPAAVRRRFVYIEAKVKKKYAKLTALDESKIPDDLEHKMDLWTFTVYRQLPKGISESFRKVIKKDIDIFGLTKLLVELFEEHDHKQDGFGKAVKEDIDNYYPEKEVVAEAGRRETNYLKRCVLFLIACMVACMPISVNLYVGIMLIYGTIRNFLLQPFGFCLWLKLKMANFVSNNCIEYKVVSKWEDFRDTTTTSTMFSYLFIKTFIFEDPRYYDYKYKFNNYSTLRRFTVSMIFFTLAIQFFKIVCSLADITHALSSEGNVIESSGNFSEENADDEIARRERVSECEFPPAKKKVNSDMDYDIVENIYPRYVSEERNKKDPDQVYNSIKRNERFLKISYQGSTFRARGVGLRGDMMLVNKHCVPGDGTTIVSSCKIDYESNLKSAVINKSDVIVVGEDAVLFRFPGELFRDISFSLTDVLPSKVSMEGRFADVKKRVVFHNYPVSVKNFYQGFSLMKSLKYEFSEHVNGDCGRPVMIVVNRKCFFVGIHSAGTDDGPECYATLINKTNIERGIKDLEKDFISGVNSEGSLRLPKGATIKPVTDRSPILFEDTPGLGVIGSISNYAMISPKTRLIKSPLVNDIEALVGESAYRDDGKMKYLPPMMRSKMCNGKYIAPYNNWIKKVGVKKKELPAHLMKATGVSLTCYLLAQLNEAGVKRLKPFTMAIAQNGYPENFYIRAIKNSTSGGFLLPGKKGKYNTPVELDFKKDAVMPDYEVKEQVLEILQSYENGELSHDIVGAQLKDEPRTFEKATSGKTRVFAMSSYPMTLVNRMYLMPFYALMCEHRDIFGTKVGINMHSGEAGEMYDSLVNFSPNIMEGDYGGYDTSMPIGIGLMANSVVENCLKNFGYNAYSMRVVRGILSDNLFPTLAMEGNIVVAAGFQPSGKYATAEDNSLRGLILLYFAYITMCTNLGEDHSHNLTNKFAVSDFFKYLKPVTYGDDMLCSVKPEISEYFNNITYSKFVEEVYGMEFTTAEKTAHTSKFIQPEKMSFLKRTFQYSSLLNRKVALLDKDSLVKSMSYILPSREVSMEVQIIETCQSVLREYFFYCESVEEYEQKRTQFIATLLKHVEFSQEDLEKLFPRGANLKYQYEANVV